MIRAEGISRVFGEVRALESVDLNVPSGTVLALLGSNGAGKSTLVNVLTTVLPPSAGTAQVAGFDIVRESRSVRARIGVTGQFTRVDDRLSGLDNLVLTARLLGMRHREARRRSSELLYGFGLEHAAGRPARTYSGGMKRRLDLAMGLTGTPEVLYLDEPTTGLDPTSRVWLWHKVEEVAMAGATVLLTTQYLEEADRLADRIMVLDAGRVQVTGTSTELKSRVGALTLRLGYANVDEAADAARVVRAAGFMAKPTHSSTKTVEVPLESSSCVPRVLYKLTIVGQNPLSVALVEPSLDDVFHALTAARRG